MNGKNSGSSLTSRQITRRPLLHPWVTTVIATSALLGMVAAFAIAPSGQEENDIHFRTIHEQLSTHTATLIGDGNATFLHEEQIDRSDTIARLLARLGISDQAASDYIRNNPEAQAISRQLRPGKIVSAKTGEDGELLALYFPLNGKDAMLIVEKINGRFVAREHTLELEKQTIIKSGEIKSSLFGATDAAGIPDTIASQLAEVFGADIDFYRDLRRGDRFSLVYEIFTHAGQPIRTGRILSAEFTNNQKTHNAYWFETEKDIGGYYTAGGTSLRKAFLRSPLEFSRVTSGFSSARLHPVFQTVRAHKGIDYGAPTGTRVRAVADGIVDFVGRQGGYGNLVVLKHQGAYSTAYGHLNSFATGLRKGLHINQDETIGFVGQTGVATGPHLHYEFRVNSVQVNPLTVAMPSAVPLNPAQAVRFRNTTESLRSQLALAKQIDFSLVEK